MGCPQNSLTFTTMAWLLHTSDSPKSHYGIWQPGLPPSSSSLCSGRSRDFWSRDTGPWGFAILEASFSAQWLIKAWNLCPVGCPWPQDFTLAFRILEKEQFSMKMEERWGDLEVVVGLDMRRKKGTFNQPANVRGWEVFVLGKTRKPTLTEHLLYQRSASLI